MDVRVKICGVTSVTDAESCIAAGADMLGLNFVASSARFVDVGTAQSIAQACAKRVEVVGVVADMAVEELARLMREVGLDRLQLHGDEAPSDLIALGAVAYKAVRIGSAADVAQAAMYPGALLLVDARVAGRLGGTGTVVAPELAAAIARTRDVLLAGGLTPDNVGDAVRAVRPWGVDVASGVEARPGRKDPQAVAAFVARAKAAARDIV